MIENVEQEKGDKDSPAIITLQDASRYSLLKAIDLCIENMRLGLPVIDLYSLQSTYIPLPAIYKLIFEYKIDKESEMTFSINGEYYNSFDAIDIVRFLELTCHDLNIQERKSPYSNKISKNLYIAQLATYIENTIKDTTIPSMFLETEYDTDLENL